ncbi:MAG: hypothetical protein ACNA7J_11670 [Wenzhouxiangella sp.]
MQQLQSAGNRAIPRVDTPSRLVVATAPDHQREAVLNILVEAGFAREGEDNPNRLPQLFDAPWLSNLDAIRDWLANNADAHLLLLFNGPVMMIARSMADGVAPAEALERWRNDVEDVLAVVRRNRRRLTLLPLDQALESPETFTKILGERFGVKLRTPVSTAQTVEAPRAMFRIMAENTIWQSVEARNLAAELDVNALPISPPANQTLSAVDEAYRQFMESEMVTALSQQQHTSAQPGESEQELQALRDEKKPTEARIQDLEEENELLLQQLHHVQEELESYYLNGVGTSHELEEARATIEAICNSKSWKITRPLRWFLEKFMGAEKAVR